MTPFSVRSLTSSASSRPSSPRGSGHAERAAGNALEHHDASARGWFRASVRALKAAIERLTARWWPKAPLRPRTVEQRLGRAGEHAAAAYLKRSGYRILGSNVVTRDGEADLVCLDSHDGSVVIVEVKTRLCARTPGSGRAVRDASVHPAPANSRERLAVDASPFDSSELASQERASMETAPSERDWQERTPLELGPFEPVVAHFLAHPREHNAGVEASDAPLVAPERSITVAKRRTLARVASALRRANRWGDRPVRIDVIAIDWPRASVPDGFDRRDEPVLRHYVAAVKPDLGRVGSRS